MFLCGDPLVPLRGDGYEGRPVAGGVWGGKKGESPRGGNTSCSKALQGVLICP